MRGKSGQRPLLVDPHEAAVADHIGGEDRRKPSFDPIHLLRPSAAFEAVGIIRRHNVVRERYTAASEMSGMGQKAYHHEGSLAGQLCAKTDSAAAAAMSASSKYANCQQAQIRGFRPPHLGPIANESRCGEA